jgi:hypothetical protein
MKLLKDVIEYLKNREEINANYGYALKNGYANDETYNWRQRLDYWHQCLAYEPKELI